MANPVKASNDYRRRNYDRILFQFPQGSREKLRAAAAAAGFASVNAWAAAVLGRAAGLDLGLHGEFGPRKPGRVRAAGAGAAAASGAAAAADDLEAAGAAGAGPEEK